MGIFLDGLREYPLASHLVVEESYVGVLVRNVTAEYEIHCASLRSVFDVGMPRRATGQSAYRKVAYFNGLEGVQVKGAFVLREGREVDRLCLVFLVGIRMRSLILRFDTPVGRSAFLIVQMEICHLRLGLDYSG